MKRQLTYATVVRRGEAVTRAYAKADAMLKRWQALVADYEEQRVARVRERIRRKGRSHS